jgi:hypothetical protein
MGDDDLDLEQRERIARERMAQEFYDEVRKVRHEPRWDGGDQPMTQGTGWDIIKAINAIPTDETSKGLAETNKLLVEIRRQLSDITWTLRILVVAAAVLLFHRAGVF